MLRGRRWGTSSQGIQYVFSPLSWINKWLTVGDAQSYGHQQGNIGRWVRFQISILIIFSLLRFLFSCLHVVVVLIFAVVLMLFIPPKGVVQHHDPVIAAIRAAS